MNSIEALKEFLGWCSVINIGILLFSTVLIILIRTSISNIHSKMFGLGREDVLRAYFQYLGHYKLYRIGNHDLSIMVLQLNDLPLEKWSRVYVRVLLEVLYAPLHPPQMPEMWKVGINHGL
jgi:hypothetical protein